MQDVVDPFKAFARKIAAQFTPEDISAVHYLANIPERVQGKLTTGVALINYLTNSRYCLLRSYLHCTTDVSSHGGD